MKPSPRGMAAAPVLTEVAADLGGTPANDQLTGLGGNDVLRGGPGACPAPVLRSDACTGAEGPDGGDDRMAGARGDDRIDARDNARGEVLCGSGRDVAIIDRRDEVASDCEVVRRGS